MASAATATGNSISPTQKARADLNFRDTSAKFMRDSGRIVGALRGSFLLHEDIAQMHRIMRHLTLKKGLNENKKKNALLKLKIKCDKLLAVSTDLYRSDHTPSVVLLRLTEVEKILNRVHNQATRPAPQKRPRKHSIYNLSKVLLRSVHALQKRIGHAGGSHLSHEHINKLTEYDADTEDAEDTVGNGRTQPTAIAQLHRMQSQRRSAFAVPIHL